MNHTPLPNMITIARIVLVAPFVIALTHLQDPLWHETARYAALGIFAVMALTDGLDGYLARKLKQETALGQFLDPLADKILIFCAMILLTREGTSVPGHPVPTWVAVLAIGKDLMVVLGFCIVHFVTGKNYIDARRPGKWCTFAQLAMVIAVLLAPDLPPRLQVLLPVLWWLASILAVAAVIHYYELGRRFIMRHEAAAAES